jgi:hypothetical protein
MFPRTLTALLGLSALGVCTTLSGAEAGRIYYTKNGHKYWFNTNSPRGKALAATRATEQRRAMTKAAVAQNAEERPEPTAVAVSRKSEPVLSMMPPAPHSPNPIRSISYDFEKGVKRTVMIDGTVFDEPFDPRAFFKAVVVSTGK